MYIDGLESERIRTRFLTEEDIPAWTDFFRDKESTRYIPIANDLPEKSAETWICFTQNRYATGRYGLQALIEKSTGILVGQCGLLLQEVNGVAEIEVGYHLLPRYRGMGYATEAARLFRDYAFEKGSAASVISIIHPENTASKNVALRNGMQLQSTNVSFKDGHWDIYRINRAHWQELQDKG